jgi:hypothetical protein
LFRYLRNGMSEKSPKVSIDVMMGQATLQG